jgi:magnesium transporter
VSAPVVDADGRLVGRITIDDVVDVIHEEHEEDIMHLGGVGGEDDLYSAIFATSRRRAFWLAVHLCAVLVASAVIGLFRATIEEMVALAILMPIVAALGGTAGIQTLTVTVRAIAMRELTSANAFRLIGKEILVGGLNGILFAFLVGAIAWAWFGDPMLGVVIGLAMVVNLLVAGLAGSALPFVLERAGIDPAIASSPFLISLTDVMGFYVFLGLATVVLL